jgi:hypothetical protein
MQGNLHVRFGERDDETDPSNGARRIISTLHIDIAVPPRREPDAHVLTVPLPRLAYAGRGFCCVSKPLGAALPLGQEALWQGFAGR